MDNSISYTKTIKAFTITGVLWGIVATAAGVLTKLQLYIYLPGDPSIAYGYLRPIYTTTLIYGAGLSLFLGAAYYFIQKSDKISLKFELIGLGSFATLQTSVALGVITILAGLNKGREYGEMTFHSDNLLVLSLVLFLVSVIIGLSKVEKPNRAGMVAIVAAAGGIAAFFLGNIGQPYGPLHSVPFQSGLQDASVQEFYRTGILGFFIVLPVLSVLFYFVPYYYKTQLFSEEMANFSALGVASMAGLAGAAGLAFTTVPAIVQSIGIFALFAFSAAVFTGVLNAQRTVSKSTSEYRSDSVGMLFRYGIFFMMLLTIIRAVLAPRILQQYFGYTWLNTLDISVDAQTYGLMILLGAALIVAQNISGRKAAGGLTKIAAILIISSVALIILSDITHGIIQVVGLSDAGTTTSWAKVLFAGSFSAEGKDTLLFIYSPRALNLLGAHGLALGVLIAGLNIISTILKSSGEEYTTPDLKVGEKSTGESAAAAAH